MQAQCQGREDPLQEEMETHSSVLTWRIPRTEELGGLQPTGLHSQTQLSMHTLSSTNPNGVMARDGGLYETVNINIFK